MVLRHVRRHILRVSRNGTSRYLEGCYAPAEGDALAVRIREEQGTRWPKHYSMPCVCDQAHIQVQAEKDALTAAGIPFEYGVDPGADTDAPMFRVPLEYLDRGNVILAEVSRRFQGT